MTVNRLAEILEEKGGDVLEIDADSSVFEAVQLMVENNVGSLLVTERGEVAGIVTERDYLRRVTLEGRTEEAPVGRSCPPRSSSPRSRRASTSAWR